MITTYAYNPDRYRKQLEAFLAHVLKRLREGNYEFGPVTTATTGFYKAPDWLPAPVAGLKVSKQGVEPMHVVVCETQETMAYREWNKKHSEIGRGGFIKWITGKEKQAYRDLGPAPSKAGLLIVITGEKGELMFVLHPEYFPLVKEITAVAYEQQIKRVDEALTRLLAPDHAQATENVA